MSRLGKQLIIIPEKVTCKLTDGILVVTGPLGEIKRNVDSRFSLVTEADGKNISLKPSKIDLETNTLWGTYASHLHNMIKGVTVGFEKKLMIEGVGYKVNLNGNKLVFALGFSHPVEVIIPDGIKVVLDKNNLTITGYNKETVGQFAAQIREQKPPEPYKGKGIRYLDEKVRRKVGKKVAATAA